LRATSRGPLSACLSSRIASVTGWASFGRCRLARWSVQRGRPDDGVGAPQVEIIGHSERISEPRRLCRPRRSAARLQAGFRRSIGGLHRQASDRLIEVRPAQANRGVTVRTGARCPRAGAPPWPAAQRRCPAARWPAPRPRAPDRFVAAHAAAPRGCVKVRC